MKTPLFLKTPVLCTLFSLALAAVALADVFSGKVSDLDAGNGYLTVTSDAAQKTIRFKVTDETVIVNSDGTKSQLLNLVEGTLVKVDAAGEGEVASKITVTPAPAQSVP